MKALILVDIQNDFLPGGALAVPGGDAIIPVANRLIIHFDLVVATQDWHPANHGSFAANHPGAKPGDVVQLGKLPQVLWPVHCVQNTRGAEFANRLLPNRFEIVFRKGTDSQVDSYSGFYDNGRKKSTGLGEWLKSKHVNELFIAGLATDYCVKFTALDAIGLGFKTCLVQDACRGVNLKEADSTRALAEMKIAGVKITSSQEILAKRPH